MSLSQGTTFSFGGTTYTVTRVSVSIQSQISQRPKISTAHLGTSIDSEEPFVLGFKVRAIDSPSQVEVECLGSSPPTAGSSGNISTTGYSGAATCISSVVTATVGELLKSTAVFRVPSPD
jgi:hypothetical protein